MAKLHYFGVAVSAALVVVAACSGDSPNQIYATGGAGAGAGAGGQCPGGQIFCGSACVPMSVYNCGECGVRCGVGQVCANRTCQCRPPAQDCAGVGVCNDLFTDPANCGSCGNACDPNLFCSRGVCAASCEAGFKACGQACINVMADPYNCGDCGKVCAIGQSCSAGACTCPAPLSACGNLCVNLNSDGANCGTCNNVCATGVCTAGVCTQTGAGGTLGTGGVTTAGTGGVVPGTGGAGGTATSGAGGSGTGGVSGTGDPPGYVRYNNWFGCAWTAVEDNNLYGTTITPQDFTARATGTPFCATGTVGNDYEAVALLGFNIQESVQEAEGHCLYEVVEMTASGPPSVQPTGTGVAFNFVKNIATTLRIQIQGSDGHRDPNDRWCWNIDDPTGPVFAPYSEFVTECWEGGTPVPYANQPISAVVFLVPGDPVPTQFDFCVDGFADGNSVADAPPTGMEQPIMKGTLGGTDAQNSVDPDFKRVKVIGDDGYEYIIQNNNWGNARGSEQVLSYEGNSFTVVKSTGTGGGGGVPASFPSIFIGLNGNVNDGLITNDSNLPAQISSISTIPTELNWSGNCGNGFNVSYDVWFAASAPAPGSYDDAISGFLMVWLCDPGDYQPIGWSGDSGPRVNIAGHDWIVSVGPRGGSGPNSGAPVINYTAPHGSPVMSMSFDLMDFINEAIQSNRGLQSGWYLTDVFGGIEIWNGPGAVGTSIQRFSAHVNL